MEFIDYYKILEIDKNAADADIKKAYRKLARKFHPDLNPNDTTAKTRFQQINEANEVLSDAEKRKKYDKYGKDWKHADEFDRQQSQQSQHANNRTGSGRQGQQNYSGEDFSDFFSSMFGTDGGQRGGRQVKYKGQDFNAELHLELKDVYIAHKQTLTVNGKSIRLSIPAGVEHGQTIKIPGHGAPGSNGGPSGDLYITFSISNHSKYKRDGNNLHTDIEIDLYTAVLGGEIMVDTFDGKVKLSVKPGTQNRSKVKLKGKGFPVYKKDGEFGDLYINYQVTIPENLTEKEKELFTELSKISKDGK